MELTRTSIYLKRIINPQGNILKETKDKNKDKTELKIKDKKTINQECKWIQVRKGKQVNYSRIKIEQQEVNKGISR